MEKSFLDSSIILEREFGSPQTKEKIEKILLNVLKSTTTYAKMEINRTFLKDAIYLYSLLIEQRDLSAVFRRLQLYPLTPREKDRCLEFLSKITDKGALRIGDAITRLANLITGLHTALFADVSLIVSGTECALAEEKIRFIPPLYSISISCTRISPECKIKEFMDTNKAQLLKIMSDTSSNPDFDELGELLTRVTQNSDIAKGRNCMVLGDTIICLDAPNHHIICSTNIRHFEPLCKSLGKKFVGIESES